MAKKHKYRTSKEGEFFDYSEGRMSDRERHDYERLQQQDPFEADAAEGLSGLTRKEAEDDLNALKDKLLRKNLKKRRVAWYSIAAVIVSIVAVTTIFINVDDGSMDRYKAAPGMSEPASGIREPASGKEDEGQVPEETKETEPLSDASESPLGKGESDTQHGEGKSGEVESRSAAGAGDYEKESAMMMENELEETVSEEILPKEDEIANVTSGAGMQGAVRTEKKDDINEDISAVVQVQPKAVKKDNINEDVKKARLIYARDKNAGQEAQAYDAETTASGKQSGKIPQPVTKARSDINGVNVSEPISVTYELADDSEIVTQDIKSDLPPYVEATPVIGIEAYKSYVDSALVDPEINGLTGMQEVILEFTISREGLPVDFKVISSPSDLHSKEAIRVIEEGPKWVPASKNGELIEEKIRLTLVFNN